MPLTRNVKKRNKEVQLNYYNEFDPFTAAWLRELISEGLIPSGDVDERDMRTVHPAELRGYTQCHFFAGIGGWSLALGLAGWPEDQRVWTGSPPCQPFSSVGNQLGKDDERHLWPKFFELIAECRPPVIFGEQVAPAIGHGWFDDLRNDMEKEGYAAGMVVLPACSVGAFHKRDRLFFVADRDHAGQHPGSGSERSSGEIQAGHDAGRSRTYRPVGDAQRTGLEGHQRPDYKVHQPGWVRSHSTGPTAEAGIQLVTCLDGKTRPIPVEPEFQPLVDGVPNRVGLIRGAGNAIVPQVAAEVIRSFMSIKE